MVVFSQTLFSYNTQTGNAQGTLDLLETLKDILAALDPDQVRVLITACPVYKVRRFYKWCKDNAGFTELATDKNATGSYAGVIQEALW